MSRASKHAGFTLLEILIALAVFAIVGAIAYRGLDMMSRNKAHLDQEIRFWRELGQVMDRMETDFTQIAPRTGLSAEGVLQPEFFYGLRNGEQRLELTRFDGQRPPARIAYRLHEQGLEMLIWTQGAYRVYRLLDHVERCEFAFLDQQHAWQMQWPIAGKEARPQGIRVRIRLAGQGDFERIFALP